MLPERIFQEEQFRYYFSDHLGTASVVTDSAGNITEDEDYYPWGGELQFVNTDSNHCKFTGKERDAETQLDYFGARYYGNWYARFLSADWAAKPEAVPYAVLDDPQSLNLYSYVRNIPTSRADADGHQQDPGSKPDYHKKWRPPDTVNSVAPNVKPAGPAPGQAATPRASRKQPSPDHLGFVFSTSMAVHDDTPGPIPYVCQSCYGAAQQFVYEILDNMGKPVNGTYTLTEHIAVLANSDPKATEISGKNVPLDNRFLADTIGHGDSKPITYLFVKTEQTFSVVFKGKEYFLTTKIHQYTVRTTNGHWMIQSQIVVP